jgi:hypothetical protein
MNYYIDTEFLEGTQKESFPISLFRKNTPNTIDLISIALVSEDNREYYAISKEFNLKEAWNRYDLKETSPAKKYMGFYEEKVYWIRENVLRPIWRELYQKGFGILRQIEIMDGVYDENFTFKSLNFLIQKFGKTNKQIAEEICQFIDARWFEEGNASKGFIYPGGTSIKEVKTTNVEFYAYYADYDWVAFCWLFGKMMDLPTGFPMYCFDLKQILDEKVNKLEWLYLRDIWSNQNMSIHTIGNGDNQEKDRRATFEEKLKRLKELKEFPKQINEHNALDDTRWNKKLHEFLKQL